MTKLKRALRGPRADEGAAAVEFALLFPIFALLTFGMLSGGLVLWHTIATTQAARDAARLGSTTPLSTLSTPPAGELSVDKWLRHSMYVAMQSAGWTPVDEDSVATTDLDSAGEEGYVCVAYVKGAGGTMTDKYLAVGNQVGTEPAGSGIVSDGKCYNDGSNLQASRVQVVIHRKEQWNMIVAAPTWTVTSRANVPYERTLP